MDPTARPVSWPARCWPQVLDAGRFTQGDRGFAQDHRNRELTIHLFSYAARVRIGGQEFTVAPDDLTLTPPDTPLAYDIPAPGVHWCLRLRPDPRWGGGARWWFPHHLRLGHALAVEARSRLERIIEDFVRAGGRTAPPGDPAAVAAVAGAQAFVAWLAAVQEPAGAATRRSDLAVRRAEELLVHPECAALPIAEIALRVGLSQNRLAAAFRRAHGMTMARYRARALIGFAQQLMASTGAPISEIARRFELRDSQRFNKFFRRQAGISPSAWRQARRSLITTSPRPALPG